MKNSIAIVCSLLLLALFCLRSEASCSYTSGLSAKVTADVSFGTVFVQRDAPVGSVLASASTGTINGGNPIVSCTTDYTSVGMMNLFSTRSSYSTSVFLTNITGVGIQVAGYPFTTGVTADTAVTAEPITIDLIKLSTGATDAGSLSTGELAWHQVAERGTTDSLDIVSINLTGNNVISPLTCSVTQSAISVPMGTVNKSVFRGTGSTSAPVNFNVSLNCDSNTKVNITLEPGSSGSYDASSGVLNLDSNDSNAATGVGLQILYNSSPVSLGESLSVGTTTADGDYSIPFTARYYQTTSAITAGTADASATFTMTYK